MRQQMRKIQPKPGAATGGGQTRRQRERYVQAGGMLQGYAPDLVIRLGYIAVGIAVACVLIIAAIVVFVPPIYGLPVAIAASIAWGSRCLRASLLPDSGWPSKIARQRAGSCRASWWAPAW